MKLSIENTKIRLNALRVTTESPHDDLNAYDTLHLFLDLMVGFGFDQRVVREAVADIADEQKEVEGE